MLLNGTGILARFARGFMLAGAVAVLSGSPSTAQGLSWEFANEYTTKEHGDVAKIFIDEVQRLVPGELTITYQSGGVLGFKSPDNIDAVEDGSVEMAWTLLPQAINVDPFFALTSLPFIVSNDDEAYDLYQKTKPFYQDIFSEHGQTLLFTIPSPPAGIFSRQPINSAADFSGLKIRTYDRNSTRTLANANAVPFQISVGDLIPQISTGAVDAVITAPRLGVDLSLWEYLPNFSAVNYSMALYGVHISNAALEKLSPEGREAIASAAALAEKYAWDLMAGSSNSAFASLREKGSTIVETPDEGIVQHLRNASKTIVEDWLSGNSEETQAEMRTILGLEK